MVYSPATKHPNGARLLALDGGGIRGVMALEVLAEVMDRVRRKKGLTEPCRPADYFELAAGTSTGGIIGIMLFRLRMTAEDAIKQYDVIASQVFSPKVYGWNIGWMPTFLSSTINNSKTLVQSSRFDDASLKKAVDGVVEKFGLDENDRKLKGDAPLQHPGSARMSVGPIVCNELSHLTKGTVSAAQPPRTGLRLCFFEPTRITTSTVVPRQTTPWPCIRTR